MSHYYGTLQGSRGQATRCGTKYSGMETVAASWDGAIRVILQHDPRTGENLFKVEQVRWNGSGVNEIIATGVIGKGTK